MKNIAIIPARGGSKRIPRKNIRDFLGKPIIGYSIRAAIDSGIFSDVMVSTDDEEIAQVAISFGATVPFFRSPEMSNDIATVSDAIKEVLTKYDRNGKVFNNFCCIYPTAPFVTAPKLQEAFEIFEQHDIDSVIPITRFLYPILRSFSLSKENFLRMNWPEYLNTRSQDLELAYHDTGQFYFVKTSVFFEQGKILTNKSHGFLVPETEVQDIDNEEDWLIAELKYKLIYEKY